MNKKLSNFTHFTGRILLALIFVLAGTGKLDDSAGTMRYMQSMGVPAILFWPTVALELLGGIAIVVGFKTRLVALVFAGFCVVSAVLFHHNFSDQTQIILFLKNVAMAGGFLLLVSSGATAVALDSREEK